MVTSLMAVRPITRTKTNFRRSGIYSLAVCLISMLALAMLGAQGLGFVGSARFHSQRSIISHILKAEVEEATPATPAAEDGKRGGEGPQKIVGEDGKTGKQRRAARHRQKKNEARGAGKEPGQKISLKLEIAEGGDMDAQVLFKNVPTKKMSCEDIAERFKEAGDLAFMDFFQHGDKSLMNMGTACYKDKAAAEKAIEILNGAILEGRKIKVQKYLHRLDD